MGGRASRTADLTSDRPVGVVLAGGASRRFGGTPKGLQLVGGVRLIDRVATALRGVTEELLVAANDPDAASWLHGVAVVPDTYPGTGGLAGVEAALGRGRDVLVVAWDMPFVTADVLQLVVLAARAHGSTVTLPESDSPYGFEPFCALYSAGVRDALTAFLERGGGAARDFVGAVAGVHRVPLAEIERMGNPRRIFFSVNTPDDLEQARAMAATR